MFYVINEIGSGQVDDGPFETRGEALECTAKLKLPPFHVLDEAQMDEFEIYADAP
jgi:hypothetical protein